MKTELQYLTDTYLFKGNAKLLSIGNDEKGFYVIFDKTIFYPQGGGQESDIGYITIFTSNGSGIIKEIQSVRFQNGDVIHYGQFENMSTLLNCNIEMSVNKEVRFRNAKLHTAGHLIASIVENMNIGLRAKKGFHFLTGSYIGFETIENKKFDRTKVLQELNEHLFKEIVNNNLVVSEILTLEELKRICDYVPSYLPKDKPLRVVTIKNYPPIPCGGTHIKYLSELKQVTATKMKLKKGEFKISYAL